MPNGRAVYNTTKNTSVDANGVVTADVAQTELDVSLVHIPASLNKCSNYNLNPTDLTGVTKGGDAASTLTLVDDSANYPDELKQVGNQQVFCIDNSAGSTLAYANIAGGVANTNQHSLTLWARAGSGTPSWGLNDATQQVGFSNATYQRLLAEDVTPADSSKALQVRCDAGEVAYFIANQLEELPFATPLIETSGAPVSRTACNIQHPYSSAYFNQDEGYLVFDWTPGYDKADLDSTDRLLFSTDGGGASILFTDVDNGLAFWNGSSRNVNENYLSGNKYRVCVLWGNGMCQLGVLDIDGDGLWAWSTPVSYDGEWGASQVALYLFANNPYNNKLHDLKIFNRDPGTAKIEERHP